MSPQQPDDKNESSIESHKTLGLAEDATGGDLRSTYAPIPKAGETRFCYDPWTFVQVLGNGQTRPCCFSGLVLGFVSDETSFEDVFNGEVAQRLRKELLTGQLDEYCKICNMKAIVPVKDFQKDIARLYKQTDAATAKSERAQIAAQTPANDTVLDQETGTSSAVYFEAKEPASSQNALTDASIFLARPALQHLHKFRAARRIARKILPYSVRDWLNRMLTA